MTTWSSVSWKIVLSGASDSGKSIFGGFLDPEWHYAGSFMHNVNDTWARYNRRNSIDVSLSDLR